MKLPKVAGRPLSAIITELAMQQQTYAHQKAILFVYDVMQIVRPNFCPRAIRVWYAFDVIASVNDEASIDVT